MRKQTHHAAGHAQVRQPPDPPPCPLATLVQLLRSHMALDLGTVTATGLHHVYNYGPAEVYVHFHKEQGQFTVAKVLHGCTEIELSSHKRRELAQALEGFVLRADHAQQSARVAANLAAAQAAVDAMLNAAPKENIQ